MIDALRKTFATNFVAYYRAHAAHANTTGRNFYSDHKLLESIYEDLQGEIDTLGEFLRTVKAEMPSYIFGVINESAIDDMPFADDADGKLNIVYEDLETLIEVYTELYEESQENIDISNYAQDRVRVLKKFCWMLRVTIGEDNDD
jgi:DNA-binding ferritin-like protein